jgi:hypothetical protein
MADKTIVQDHKENFDTLVKAFRHGDVCLMDCVEKATGEHVAVICACVPQGEDMLFTPFAKFFNGNPYELLSSPMEYLGEAK